MSAELQIDAGEAAAAESLSAALTAAGVVHGIDDGAVRELASRLDDPHFTARTVVARGTPAQPGCDGRVELKFERGPLPGSRTDANAIDYRERSFLHPAAAGAAIARLVPPQPGADGRCVLGRTLPAPPVRPARLRVGAGAELRSDGEVVALRDGVVCSPTDAIDVVTLFEHRGDVDLHCGNLHSRGSVRVAGDLAAGFRIEADGDVELAGTTFGGTVLAGGSVRVGLGVLGASRVEAGGEVHCRHASSSTVIAAGRLVARDELVHCQAAAAAIELLEGRGRVLGGSLRARDRIDVLHAGTAGGAPTLLVAADLTSESAELVRRQLQVERVERRAQKVHDRASGPQKGGKSGRHRAAAADEATAERLRLAQRRRELLRTAHVEIRGEAYPGVRIQFGSTSEPIQALCRGVRFRWDADAGKIVQEPT